MSIRMMKSESGKKMKKKKELIRQHKIINP